MPVPEKFFGGDKTLPEYEFLSHEHAKKPFLKKEPDLFGTKWWDYRFIHPARATYLFSHHFLEAHADYMAQVKDCERRHRVPGYRGKDFLKADSKTRTAIWTARMFADEMGVPYGFYCRSAMRRAIENIWRRPPLACQLYCDEMIEWIAEDWRTEQAHRIRKPADPLYRIANDKGWAVQEDFRHWLCLQIAGRPQPRHALLWAIEEDGFLSWDWCARNAPPELLENARRLALFG